MKRPNKIVTTPTTTKVTIVSVVVQVPLVPQVVGELVITLGSKPAGVGARVICVGVGARDVGTVSVGCSVRDLVGASVTGIEALVGDGV